MKIIPATLADWPEIRDIYRDGILTNQATFNTVDDIPATGEAWFAGKIDGWTWKAVDENGVMLGWVTVSPTSKRRVYQGIVEDSVYIAEHAKGKGVASALLNHLITEADNAGFWTIEAKIFPENKASIHLHEKFGFRIVGIREKIAQQHGVWRDVTLMERRSKKI